MDWVRLSSAIERNRTSNFVWEIEPNRTQSIGLCSIGFGHRTQSNTIQLIKFDWVRLPNFFVWVRFRSIAEINRTQSMDWVRLNSIEFDWNSVRLGSIDYAGLYRDKTDSGQLKPLVLIWWSLIGTHLVLFPLGLLLFLTFVFFLICITFVTFVFPQTLIFFSQEWLTLHPLRPLWNRRQSRRQERRRTWKPDLSDLTKTWRHMTHMSTRVGSKFIVLHLMYVITCQTCEIDFLCVWTCWETSKPTHPAS